MQASDSIIEFKINKHPSGTYSLDYRPISSGMFLMPDEIDLKACGDEARFYRAVVGWIARAAEEGKRVRLLYPLPEAN